MYTEIFVNVDLKRGVPDEVIEILKAICGEGDESALQDKPRRWSMLFYDGGYLPATSCRNLTLSDGQWSLLGKGSIKNYENEIEEFFDWLRPWINAEKGEFIGYLRYETSLLPELVLM
jgi:hypothetical protein